MLLYSDQLIRKIFSVSKPGRCPKVSQSSRCERECSTDADCGGDQKCCRSSCGSSCLSPAREYDYPTRRPQTQERHPPGSSEPRIRQPESPQVSGQEGGYVTMSCIVVGTPTPTLVWKKDAKIVNSSSYKILLKSSKIFY